MATLYRRYKWITAANGRPVRHLLHYGVQWRDQSGQHQRSLSTTDPAVAQQRLAAFVSTLARPAPTDAQTLTMSGLSTRYTAWAAAHHSASGSTQATRTGSVREWIKVIGDGEIRKVSKDNINAFKIARLEEVEPVTVNLNLCALRAMVNIAIEEGWYRGDNPFAKFRALPEHKRIATAWNEQQLAAFLEAAERDSELCRLREIVAPPVNPLWIAHLGPYQGLRQNEIANARTDWFDLAGNTLHVKAGPGFQIKDRAERSMPLHPRVRELYERLKPPEGYLVVKWRGESKAVSEKKPLRVNVAYIFGRICCAAGLNDFQDNTHVMRHTFASRLARAGVPLIKIARWMGHTHTYVTEMYAHLCPDDRDIERIT